MNHEPTKELEGRAKLNLSLTHSLTLPSYVLYGLIGVAWLTLLTSFCPNVMLWGAQNLGQIIIIVSAAVAVYLLPGYTMLRVFWREDKARPLTAFERFVLALGIGIALPPLLLELAYWSYVPWNTWTTVIYIGSAGVALWLPRLKDIRRELPSSLRFAWPTWVWYDGLSWGVLGVALLVRLYIARDLPVGLWGDSYQHTVMAQLLVDHQGLFSSWEPYAPLTTFTYHFGFHANVAFFHWLTGVPVTQSVLYVGQVLNLATIAILYVLTTQWTQNRAAGLWAVLLAGFINTQPIYFVNWGRYTQLAGQVVLPVVLLAWQRVLASASWSWPRMIFAAVMTASLMLTHYIVTIFAVVFLAIYWIALGLRDLRWAVCRALLRRTSITVMLALLLSLPWLLNIFNGYLLRNTVAFVNGEVSAERIASYASLPPIAPFHVKSIILLLALLGFLWACAQRQWRTALLAVWSLSLLLLVVPQVVSLPGAGVVDSLTAYIALYIPVTPLAAHLLGNVQEWTTRWLPRVTQAGTVVVILFASVWSVSWQQHIIDPKFQLMTMADARAMEWIRRETPSDARFLVNAFPAYGGTLIAGSDAGWWLPLLTGRKSNLPPLTYGSERHAQPDYYTQTNGLVATLRERALTDASPIRINLTTPQSLEALRRAGITHIYRGASVATGGTPTDWIDTTLLYAHPSFRLLYQREGVEIFQFVDTN